MRRLLAFISIVVFTGNLFGQVTTWSLDDISYANPKAFVIRGIQVKGAIRTDVHAIKIISGLAVDEKIMVPGDDISKAVKNLWDQELFADVYITAEKVQGDDIFLVIHVKEKPRLHKFRFVGEPRARIKNDLREKIKLVKGQILTNHRVAQVENTVRDYYVDKGFRDAKVWIDQSKSDSLPDQAAIVHIHINIGERVRIQDINFAGNTNMKDGKLRRQFKDTKRARWWNVFSVSKFIRPQYSADLKNIPVKYSEEGFRDARITYDTIYDVSSDRMNIDVTIDEGRQYYFGDIEFVGNTKRKSSDLRRVLGIKSGDVYNQKLLETRLYANPNGTDVSSLYLDEGYLFFSVDAVEKRVVGDSIDLEIRIYEGRPARIDRVIVNGNTKTNDKVIMRALRTQPGNLFKRSDLLRSQQELIAMGYFDQQQLGVVPIPNPENGTVDIEYTVVEKPSDQIELSAGWGGNRVVGTLGLSFNNFSTKNVFKKGAWRPLPAGDGQRLSIRAQSTGTWFQSYNLSFTEPWLGGKKPNSFTMSAYHSFYSENGQTKRIRDANGKLVRDENGNTILNPNRAAFKTYGVALSLGRRLKIPDDYFTLNNQVNYQYFVLENSSSQFIFSDGFANNLNFATILQRSSIFDPIFPESGTKISLTCQVTPPYSLFRSKDTDYASMAPQEKYNLLEYHKWKLNSQWFLGLAKNLVLNTKIGYGYLGSYNKELGTAPFERFYLGGDGLTNFQLDGREIIALRGYNNGALSPSTGAAFVSKYTMELRYKVTGNPAATIFGVGFLEAGNSVIDFRNFKPFEVRRSAGFGVRIFMPMFGLLGLDWGYPLDLLPGQTKRSGQVHFTIGGNINGW